MGKVSEMKVNGVRKKLVGHWYVRHDPNNSTLAASHMALRAAMVARRREIALTPASARLVAGGLREVCLNTQPKLSCAENPL